jgi:phosphoribosylanthranilate isomerase
MRVKICGITRVDDAIAAVDAGADAIGFIFVPASPRYIDPESASVIVRALPRGVTPVGVFVNEPRDEINRTVERSGIRALQLHGEEPPGATAGYSVPVIKSFRVGEGFSIEILRAYTVTAILLDAFVPGVHGGTGKTFDWNIAIAAKAYGRIIVSGGLHAGNVSDAIHRVRPYAIDVSSGVEAAPGVKDPKKLTALFRAVRDTEAETESSIHNFPA